MIIIVGGFAHYEVETNIITVLEDSSEVKPFLDQYLKKEYSDQADIDWVGEDMLVIDDPELEYPEFIHIHQYTI